MGLVYRKILRLSDSQATLLAWKCVSPFGKGHQLNSKLARECTFALDKLASKNTDAEMNSWTQRDRGQ